MAADAQKVLLTAYDSVGNQFYQYEFKHEGELIQPNITFTAPMSDIEVGDSVMLRYFPFDPQQNSTISFYYTDKAETTGGKLIQANVPAQVTAPKQICWHTRDVYPKGDYYVYAVIRNSSVADTTLLPTSITLVEDTIAPPAPTDLKGGVQDGKMALTWQNPNRLVTVNTPLADFSDDMAGFEVANEEAATAQLTLESGALRVDFDVDQAWATTSADYVFEQPTASTSTPTLSFRMRGNGTSSALRIVVKNMANNHEDWWYTEQVTLSSTEWKDYTIYIPSLSAFDWYSNSDTKCRLDGMLRICFSVSPSAPAAGTFWLDDILLTGQITPAKDYTQTVIIRREDRFADDPTDGVEVYRGNAESCVDNEADLQEVYYYAAFAADDRNNWSAAAESAQWITTDTALPDQPLKKLQNKIWQDQQLLILKDDIYYNVLGTTIKR